MTTEDIDDRENGEEIHPAWWPVIARRVKELDSGTALTIPAEDVFAEVLARLGHMEAGNDSQIQNATDSDAPSSSASRPSNPPHRSC
ncbi:MAG TPA: hypothetical protein VFQ39_11980 [Longimicrobium sp.]|nr:hypothetical protein [Longimicrobium sp.]